MISPATGAVLATFRGAFEGAEFGADILSLGDVNGDGAPEFAVTSDGLHPGGLLQAFTVKLLRTQPRAVGAARIGSR